MGENPALPQASGVAECGRGGKDSPEGLPGKTVEDQNGQNSLSLLSKHAVPAYLHFPLTLHYSTAP